MTMMQKMQAKKSKKGFTLVELVIVIAILAILAAIAIPVITTTINSSKMSTMESDCTTVAMLVKEAVNTQMAGISTTKYGSKAATDETLTVGDVLAANDIAVAADDKGSFFTRSIGGEKYTIGYTTTDGVLAIAVAGSGKDVTTNTVFTSATTIKSLVDATGNKTGGK